MGIWLTLHLIGVVIFLGNVATAAFWKVRADISRNASLVHSTVKNVMLADYAFTLPGLALIVLSGIVMAIQAGIPLAELNWLTVSLALFAVTGAIWLAVLLPIQRAMIRHSGACLGSGTLSAAYYRASRYWTGFGIAATLLPFVILVLMVTRSF
jgi:uncharacterized membrane protein